jgi:hypothetical protein
VSAAEARAGQRSDRAAARRTLAIITSDKARARIVCRGAFRRNRAYDAPHPSKSSQRKRINAHLSIVCTGPGAGATHVTVVSRMTAGKRVGAPGRDSGLGRARTGGDLACVTKKRAYVALGNVHIKFPPRYSPPTATASVRSPVRAFRKNRNGICIKP